MRKTIILFMLMISCGLYAVENKTKLVVGITVSQFYPEWLSVYHSDLGEGGLKRILDGGKNAIADYEYLYSQSGTDQATIYTGLLPAEHGIVAHDWYDRLRGKRKNNVGSEEYMMMGTGSDQLGYGPDAMQALTLGCALKMNDVFSKVYSIGMNPEDAILSGGTCSDMAMWFSETNGNWVSSTFYADSLPGWLKSYNSKMESDFFIRRGWMPLAEEQSNTIALKLKNKVGIGNSFYYDIAQAKKKFNTYRVLKATPYANTMVVDLAERLITETGMGKDNDVDLLALNFACLDYMNRDFNVYAKEFQDLVMRMDQDVKRLLTFLDEKVGRDNYTVFFTFTEARELLPDELSKLRVQGGSFSVFKAVALLKSYLNLVYGAGEWVTDYDAGQLYLNRDLIEQSKLSLRDFQDNVASFMIEFEGISKVLTAYALTHSAFSTGQELLIQNAFSQKRSGDVMFSLLPSWVPELKDKEDTFFRYTKRNKVPVYFYGAGVGTLVQRECSMMDILPTICRIAGITQPYTARGKSIIQ